MECSFSYKLCKIFFSITNQDEAPAEKEEEEEEQEEEEDIVVSDRMLRLRLSLNCNPFHSQSLRVSLY